MATVNIVNICKTYGPLQILNQVSLSVEKGEFLAVVGPSGCGKSTLLRLVAGLDSATSGDILINGQCVNATPPHKRDIAMVFQTYALYPHMTVYDNMAYGLKMRGMKASEINKRVQNVAGMLQLADYLERKPNALSGGQRQRVAMGRAIVRAPAVFLFDEPLSNLDAKLRGEMRHEIKKLHQELKTTCLYVTHDQTEAMTMASRILVLNKGRIEQIGTPETLYQQPASVFVAGFTGMYPINLLPGRFSLKDKCVILDNGIRLPMPKMENVPACQEKLLLGIRPEHMQIVTSSNHGLSATVQFVDNMGADKLVHAHSQEGLRYAIRVPADQEIQFERISLSLMLNKANLFQQSNGLRLGGWDDKTANFE